MPTETLTKNGRVVSAQATGIPPTLEEDELRKFAVRHLEHVRKFKLYLSIYVISLLVLTPVWMVTQYESADGWPEHLSTRSRYPGDWDPWIIWVALIGGAVVVVAGLRAYYFDKPATEAQIDRESRAAEARLTELGGLVHQAKGPVRGSFVIRGHVGRFLFSPPASSSRSSMRR